MLSNRITCHRTVQKSLQTETTNQRTAAEMSPNSEGRTVSPGTASNSNTVTRAFAWESNRLTPGAHTLSQPAGPLDGLIWGTGFWAISGPVLGPRARYLTDHCEAHGPRFVAAFGARNPGLRFKGPKGGATAFLVPRKPKFTKLPHSNPVLISVCGDCAFTAGHTIRNVKRHLAPHDQTHTPASQNAQSQSSRREAESSLHEA